MSGEALELALALHRAPIRRLELRDRPLPDDIGTAIRIASAPQPLLDTNAERLRVPPDTLLEAVRFYLQQVLFEPGTDAYRVLGVAPNAPTDLIRDHYHWLQRWLHPDRRGEDWEALLTTRVIWAWHQLRTDAVRSAYDSERSQQVRAPDTGHDRSGVKVAASGWTAIPAKPAHTSWRTRILVGLSFGSCVALLVLALTRQDQPPSAEALGQAVAVTTAEGGTEYPRPASAHGAATSTAEGTIPAPPATLVPLRSFVAKDMARIAKPAATYQVNDLHQTQAIIAIIEVSAVPQPPAEIQVATSPTTPAVTARQAPRKHSKPSRTSLAGAAATVPPPAAAPRPQLASATASRTTSASAAAPTTSAVVASAPTAAPITPATAAAVAITAPPASLLQRTAMARQRVQAIVAYFRRTDDAQPTWQDAREPFSAQRGRAALREHYGAEAALFALDPPTWELSVQQVRFDAIYYIRNQGQVLASGRFSLRMAWAGDDWQVARVKLESAP